MSLQRFHHSPAVWPWTFGDSVSFLTCESRAPIHLKASTQPSQCLLKETLADPLHPS